jgi:hypothetical protein
MVVMECVVTMEMFYFNFSNLKYCEYKIYIPYVFTSHSICVYSFYPVE